MEVLSGGYVRATHQVPYSHPSRDFTDDNGMVSIIIEVFNRKSYYRLMTLGHDFKKGPIPNGCRKKVVNWLYRVNGKFWMLICGVCVSHTDLKEFDYSFYLGPDYKEKKKSIKKCSTIIANHVSWIDTQNIYQYHDVAFALDAGFINVPLMGKLG